MITPLKSALAGLALAGCLFAPVHAQTPPPAVVETSGVSIEDARAWLIDQGRSVGEPVWS